MPALIRTIARELNTSTASVSRALNDQPGVSETLRARILQKAGELNYIPNATARGLATSQTFAIGFFVRRKPDLSAHNDPFYSEIMHGVEQSLAHSDYHLTIGNLTDSIVGNPTTFRFVRERRIDGMILAGPDIAPDFILSMLGSQLPVVLVDNALEFSPVHAVNCDDEGGAYLAAQHLLTLGHTRIGVLSGPEAWASNRRRVQGYRRAVGEVGLPLTVIHADRTTIESGQAAYAHLMTQAPDLTAIGAVNDSMAVGAIRAAQAAGRRIPAELSVVGFDNIAWSQLNDPPLTTLDVPKRQMGLEAAHRLLSLLSTPEDGVLPTQLNVAVRLIERGSTAAPQRG
ncbi:MAG: LacI family DNA-binding transcriptional regulator [Aggregatilineales bacterium]